MITGRGGMGSHKHGISGYAPRSPRYKFTQTLEANKEPAARKRRPALTATTIKEALETAHFLGVHADKSGRTQVVVGWVSVAPDLLLCGNTPVASVLAEGTD